MYIDFGKKVLACALLVGLCASQAFAGGYQIYQAGSAEAKGLGAAVVGRDDLISNAWYNPAAVMDFEKDQYSSGYSFAILNHTYKPGNGIDNIKNKNQTHMIPNAHWIHKASDDVTAAISMYAPFGLGLKWSDSDIRKLMDSNLYNSRTVPAGTLGAAPVVLSKGLPTLIDLQVPYINGTLATKLSEKLSVAGGLSLMQAKFKMRMLSRATALTPAPVKVWDNFVKYQADGWGIGYVLAGHYKVDKNWKLGLRYLSNSQVKMTGTVEDHPAVGNSLMKGIIKLPATLTFGFANSSIKKWIFSCDVVWTEWNKYQELKIEPANGGQTAGGFSSPKNWKNTLAYRFGAEYKHDKTWIYRVGYVYDNSPLPDSTRGLELPGTDGHIYSFGVTRKGRKFDVDFGYSYMKTKDDVAGIESMNGVGSFVDGDNHFVSFNISRTF